MSPVGDAHAKDVLASIVPSAAEPIAAEARFDAMVRAHYGQLCRFAYRYVRSRADAEDVVQVVLARIWDRVLRFDFEDPLPYLHHAVRNQALSHLRRARVHDRWASEGADSSMSAALRENLDVSQMADASELSAAIVEAVNALPPRCREIFKMQRERGMTYGEIARVLAVSEKTVENQMGRALKALRVRLARYLPTAVLLFLVSR